jgi:hypothetical protein
MARLTQQAKAELRERSERIASGEIPQPQRRDNESDADFLDRIAAERRKEMQEATR